MDWYCWEAKVDGLPTQATYESYDGTRLPKVAEFFPVANSWIVDNREGLLTSHVHMNAEEGGDVAGGKVAYLRKVEVDVYRPQEVQNAVVWDIPRKDRIIPREEIDQRGVGIRINGDGNDGGNENDLIEMELDVEVPDGLELVIKRTSNNLRVYGDSNATTPILSSGNQAVIDDSMLPPRSYWVEASDAITSGDISFVLRASVDIMGSEIVAIPFRTFTTMVTALSGETGFGSDPATHGTYYISLDLYKKGYNIHYYPESQERRSIAEMNDQGNRCKVREAAIFGYSHGGGSTYQVADASPGGLNIKFTGYIDAVRNSSSFNPFSEERRPTNTNYHFNYYQRNGRLRGKSSSPAADLEKDLTATTNHGSIDNDPGMIRDLKASLEDNIAP